MNKAKSPLSARYNKQLKLCKSRGWIQDVPSAADQTSTYGLTVDDLQSSFWAELGSPEWSNGQFTAALQKKNATPASIMQEVLDCKHESVEAARKAANVKDSDLLVCSDSAGSTVQSKRIKAMSSGSRDSSAPAAKK